MQLPEKTFRKFYHLIGYSNRYILDIIMFTCSNEVQKSCFHFHTGIHRRICELQRLVYVVVMKEFTNDHSSVNSPSSQKHAVPWEKLYISGFTMTKVSTAYTIY